MYVLLKVNSLKNKLIKIIVHGEYSEWSKWTDCYKEATEYNLKTTFNYVRSRFRLCNNPEPKNGGMSCSEQLDGSDIETQLCFPNMINGINIYNIYNYFRK